MSSPEQSVSVSSSDNALAVRPLSINLGDLLDVSLIFAGIMFALWTAGVMQSVFIGVILAWVFFSVMRSRRTAEELGLSGRGFRASAWVVAAAALIAAVSILIAWRLKTLHAVLHGFVPETSFAAYTVWALMQQFLLMNIFLYKFLRILRSRLGAVLLAGILFATAHIPNPLLMAVTLTWGVVGCVLFLRYRNLYTLALAHAIMGLTLAITVPDAMQHQMRVGMSYLRWHPAVHRGLVEPQ